MLGLKFRWLFWPRLHASMNCCHVTGLLNFCINVFNMYEVAGESTYTDGVSLCQVTTPFKRSILDPDMTAAQHVNPSLNHSLLSVLVNWWEGKNIQSTSVSDTEPKPAESVLGLWGGSWKCFSLTRFGVLLLCLDYFIKKKIIISCHLWSLMTRIFNGNAAKVFYFGFLSSSNQFTVAAISFVVASGLYYWSSFKI